MKIDPYDFSKILGMPSVGFSKAMKPGIDFSKILGMPSVDFSKLNKPFIDFNQISKSLGFDNYKDQMLSLTEKVVENRIAFDEIFGEFINSNTEKTNEGFTINPNGTLTINEILYESSEITNAFTVLEETLSEKMGFEQNITELFSKLSHRHPVIMWILNNIVLVLFWGTIASIMASKVTATPSVIQNYNIRIDSINPQNTINTIVKNAKPFLNEQTLVDNYKFVRIKSLKVYNSKHSVQYIGELRFGQVATVLGKSRKWVLIETIGSDGNYIKGWVRSKYLK